MYLKLRLDSYEKSFKKVGCKYGEDPASRIIEKDQKNIQSRSLFQVAMLKSVGTQAAVKSSSGKAVSNAMARDQG